MPKEVETIDLTPQQQLAKDAGTAGETRVGISNDSPTTLTLASETFPGQVPAGEKPEATKDKGVYVVKHTAIHVEPYMRELGDEFTPADLALTQPQLDRLLALKAIEAKTVAVPVTAEPVPVDAPPSGYASSNAPPPSGYASSNAPPPSGYASSDAPPAY